MSESEGSVARFEAVEYLKKPVEEVRVPRGCGCSALLRPPAPRATVCRGGTGASACKAASEHLRARRQSAGRASPSLPLCRSASRDAPACVLSLASFFRPCLRLVAVLTLGSERRSGRYPACRLCYRRGARLDAVPGSASLADVAVAASLARAAERLSRCSASSCAVST